MLAVAHDNALDAGPRKTAPGTERFCAATGEVKPVDEMIRFVVGPDGAAVPDIKRRLQGRGISRVMLAALRDNARRLGFAELYAPLRPTDKHREPLTAFADYVARRRTGLEDPREISVGDLMRSGGRDEIGGGEAGTMIEVEGPPGR